MSVTIVLPLFLAAALIYLTILLSPNYNIHGFCCSRVFVYLVFNSTICAILAKSCRLSPSMFSAYEVKEDQGEDGSPETGICSLNTSSEGRDHGWGRKNIFVYDGDGVEDDDYSSDGIDVNGCYGSDGYCEDNDDSGSDGVVGWEDEEEEEEYDNDLEVRIEAFIAKVINGWREELLREKNLIHLSSFN